MRRVGSSNSGRAHSVHLAICQDKWLPAVPMSIPMCRQVSSSPSAGGRVFSAPSPPTPSPYPKSFQLRGLTSLLPSPQLLFSTEPCHTNHTLSWPLCPLLSWASTPGSWSLLWAPPPLCLFFSSPSPPSSPLMARFSLLAMFKCLLVLGSSRCFWLYSPSHSQ